MKAIIYDEPGDPGVLHIGEWEDPEPGAGQVLVKVEATAINRADILQRRGKYPPPRGASPLLGLEMAGTVVRNGPQATKWKEGDKVFGLLPGGGYAGYAVIHEDMALPVPARLSMEEAAAIPEAFLTAFQALYWLGKLRKGETVLVHAGASGVGTAAIQLAREAGAGIVATASSSKHALCHDLGAETTIDYHKGPFEEAVMEATKGRGIDVVIDFIAAPYLDQNIRCLRTDGRLVLLATLGGSKTKQFDMGPVLFKRLHIIGSTLRSRSLDYKIGLTKAFNQTTYKGFNTGELRSVIDSVYDWREVANAHRKMENNENQGKIVLKITG